MNCISEFRILKNQNDKTLTLSLYKQDNILKVDPLPFHALLSQIFIVWEIAV